MTKEGNISARHCRKCSSAARGGIAPFAAWWGAVLLAGCGESPPPPPENKPVTASAFTVKALTVERSGPQVHLAVTAMVKNPGAAPLTLTAPGVQLMKADGKPADPFIAPGLEPAVLAPGAETEAAMHWWLGAEDVRGALVLDIGGARAEVKSAADFALDLLPENKPVALSFPHWKLP